MSAQRVVLSDKLAAHLQKKGVRYVLMDVAFCKSCGGAVGELFARLMRDAEVQETLARADVRRLPCEDERGSRLHVNGEPAELIVANPSIKLDAVVHLSPCLLLGSADLKMQGVRY